MHAIVYDFDPTENNNEFPVYFRPRLKIDVNSTIVLKSREEEFGSLTPMYEPENGVNIGERLYKSVYHYFESQQYRSESVREIIRQASSVQEIKDLIVKNQKDRIVNVDALEHGVRALLNQHKKIRLLLLSTENRQILYHNTDKFFGDGVSTDYDVTSTGKNWYGRILMRLRAELKS